MIVILLEVQEYLLQVFLSLFCNYKNNNDLL